MPEFVDSIPCGRIEACPPEMLANAVDSQSHSIIQLDELVAGLIFQPCAAAQTCMNICTYVNRMKNAHMKNTYSLFFDSPVNLQK